MHHKYVDDMLQHTCPCLIWCSAKTDRAFLCPVLLQHIVLSVKFFIAYVIPDTPSDITLAKRRVSSHRRSCPIIHCRPLCI